MVQKAFQSILVGFKDEAARQQAMQRLKAENFSSVKSSFVPSTRDAVPRKRTFGSDGLKAAGVGGTTGAIIGGLIMIVALNSPIQGAVHNYATPLSVLFVLIGAAFGASASGLMSFFAGIDPERSPIENYKLSIEASTEEIKRVTNIVLSNGGHLL